MPVARADPRARTGMNQLGRAVEALPDAMDPGLSNTNEARCPHTTVLRTAIGAAS